MDNLKYMPGIPVDSDLVKWAARERLSICLCGGEPKFIFTEHNKLWARIQCGKCRVATATQDTPEAAAEVWNETMHPERHKLPRDNARFFGLVACALSAGTVIVAILQAFK